jgi:multiple sugar transport system permease protein
MVVWDGDASLKTIRGELVNFEAAHPGVKVTLENVDFTTYFQKLLTQYAADVAPDIAMMDAGHFQSFARRNALYPLQQFFSSTAGFRVEDYYPQAIASDTYQGKLWVLPRDVSPVGLIYYNKRAFDEAGIPYPDGTWTWDFQERPQLREKDFLWVLHKLTKVGADGKVERYGFTPAWPTALADTFAYSQGARYANNSESPTELYFNDPRVVRAHQLVADLSLKDHWLPGQSSLNNEMQASGMQLFVAQKVAMYQSGIWDCQEIRLRNVFGSPDFFDWDIALAPAYKDGTRGAPAGGSGYSIMRSTPHPKEAWELTQWMAGEHGMKAMAAAGVAQPAIQKYARSAPWIPDASTPAAQQIPKSRILTDVAVQYQVSTPTADFWQELSDLENPKLDPIWLGTSSAKDALDQVQDVTTNRLHQILQQRNLSGFNWAAGGVCGAGLILGIVGWVYMPERRKKLSPQGRRENRVGYAFMSPGLIGLLVFSIGPMVLSLLMSFADWDIITPAHWRGVGNFFEAFFQDSRFWKCLAVTGIYTVLAVPLGVLMNLVLALLLNTKVGGISIFRTFFYMPALASTVAASLIWKKIFQEDGGLANTVIYGAKGDGNLFGLGHLFSAIAGKPGPPNWLANERLALPSIAVMSIWAAGGGMIILLAGLQGVPQFYYEAATLDGASVWQRFRHVTLPLIAPSLFFVLVTGVIGSFQTFTQAFVITQGGPNDTTRFYMYHLYDQAFRNLRMGYASALAWILFFIILAVTVIQFRLSRNIHYEADLR